MKFGVFLDRAIANRGSLAAVEEHLPAPRSADELRAYPADRYLSMMTKQVFRAGFVWKVIEAKWDGFEDVFEGFDPHRLALLSDEDLETIAGDTRIIRNYRKVLSVRRNAQYVLDQAARHGSFGTFIADWPEDDIVGLWSHLKKHAARLGGNSGPMFLRMVRKDTFVLSADVSKALIGAGVVEKAPTSARAQAAVQNAFNAWHDESGRPYCQISRILALSVG